MAALSLKEFYHRYGTGVPNSWEQCEQIWNAATEYAVENCHSTQQLKAEIASIVNSYSYDGTSVDLVKMYPKLLDELRQLSAV